MFYDPVLKYIVIFYASTTVRRHHVSMASVLDDTLAR